MDTMNTNGQNVNDTRAARFARKRAELEAKLAKIAAREAAGIKVTFGARISADTKDAVEALAKRQGISASAMVATWIETALELALAVENS